MSKKFLQTSGLALGLGLLLAGATPINNAKADLVVHVPPEYFDLKLSSLNAGPVRVYEDHITVDKAAGTLTVNLTEEYPKLKQVWKKQWGDSPKDWSSVAMVLVPQDKNEKVQEVIAGMDMWPAYPAETTVGYVLNNSTLKLTHDKGTGNYTLNVETPAPQPQAQK